jgi:hypothetical protein
MAVGSDCSGDLANIAVMGPVAMTVFAWLGSQARALTSRRLGTFAARLRGARTDRMSDMSFGIVR